VQRLSLNQPELQFRGATASLERQRTLKRCRHLLDAWSAQRLATLEQCIAQLLEAASPGPAAALPPGSGPTVTPDLQPLAALLPAPLIDMEERIDQLFASLNADALRFQEAYYSERRYLGALDQRRCAGYGEILAAPAA
jgi:DNA primase